MNGRGNTPSTEGEVRLQEVDTSDMRLGDLMRGERATMAKSLLDVQRDLRIKASYIAAIENADLSVFETASFVPGFVRSYARYLGMDQEAAFLKFCAETGFRPAHGLATTARPAREKPSHAEPLANPDASFIPRGRAPLTTVEPRALGSVLVLALLLGGIGYGAWSVLQEVQRVQLAPVEQVPGVVAELDPLEAAAPAIGAQTAALDALPARPAIDGDRLYRPQALEQPVLTERDGPIAGIDPKVTGLLAGAPTFTDAGAETAEMAALETPGAPAAAAAVPGVAAAEEAPVVRTLGADAAEVAILAVRPSWVRVSAADGSVLLEKVMDAGERYALPKLAEAPVLRTGESGAIYFAVNGTPYGPAGARGAVTKNIRLSPETLTEAYAAADPQADGDLAKTIAVANAAEVLGEPAAE